MDVVVERCCGLDVHKKTVVACVRIGDHEQVRSFGTVTREVLRLLGWLQQERITVLAMESTGSYWKPVWNLLEGNGIELMLVNPAHMKAVPGRKTDIKDAQWIAQLLQHGLLTASRIPERWQRELQEAVRYRRSLIEERAQEVNRLQKVLEGGNIKLGDVATDVLGRSGRRMLEELASGQTDSDRMAALAEGRLRSKRSELTLALEGSVGPSQRFLLRRMLTHIDFLDGEIETLNEEIESRMRPFEPILVRLDEIPGVGRRNAETILAEVGPDMRYWRTAKAFASWAKLCPGNNESAGKRRSSSIGRGRDSLRTAFVEAARAATHVKNSYLSALYNRLKAKHGPNSALVAVAHTLLVTVYCMLRDGTYYQDLGSEHFVRHDRDAILRRNVRRLESLGYIVTLTPAA